MIAAALGTVLLFAEHRPARAVLVMGAVALSLVVATGIAARLILPSAPNGYPAMLAS